MLVMMFLFIFVYFAEIPLNDAHCMDIHHHIVSQGLHYVPGPNPCTLCICDKGNPKWCKQVLCSPPQNCKSFEVGNSCCEFKCLDDILSKSDNYSETYDLALRLIASAVTAVLSLSLLFFLIHRLRQRKIRLRQNRQMSEDQRSLNSIGYITGSLGYLPGSIGYLGSGNNEMEFHYDESNVHYPLWKPPGNYFPRGEAPPPYEEAVRAARTEAELANNQVNTAAPPFTFSSNRNENVSLTLVHNTHVSITPSVQQTGVASSQCNVMLHQSNLQAVQPETRIVEAPPELPPNNQTNSSTSVSLACGSGVASHDYVIDSSSSFIQNATLESQVDVHYENYNHHNPATVAPVVTVSVKNEESFPKQALNVDFLRDRIERNTYPDKIPQPAPASLPGTSNENHQNKNENTALSCSSSWRREAAQHVIPAIQPSVNTHELKQKLMDKKQNYKVVDSIINTASSSKSYRSENQLVVDPKYKKCNIIKDARSGKSLPGRTYDKQRQQQQKCHPTELHKEMLLPESNKHRTIPQKFSKTLGNLDSEICYVNTSEFTRKKDDDFSEHCDLILKQHNIDKIRYAAEKLDKQKSEKTLNASIRNSLLCAPAELRNAQKRSGILRSDMSSHRTLPKNLRELSEAFYFNFDNTACEEMNLECLVKKSVPRNLAPQTETPLSSACLDKPIKNDVVNPSQMYTGNGTLGRQKLHSLNQEKKSIMSTNSSNNVIVSSCNVPNKMPPSCYRNAIESVKTASDKCDLNKDIIEPPEIPPPPLLERERERERERDRDRDRRDVSCVSYRCNSPVQDDVDDYRSECENCKSLSFEDCNDEEGDLLNETMTLQRRPMEQGEEHSFYRTSLTLPSHTKKTARSVTLNTPRESWFMAMQEITSSSESD